MTVAMVVATVVYYRYWTSATVPTAPISEEQQLLSIISAKNLSDCATLTNDQYRLVCEQVLSAQPQGKGTQLQTTSAESMTTVQLQTLLKNAPSQLYPAVRFASTTP